MNKLNMKLSKNSKPTNKLRSRKPAIPETLTSQGSVNTVPQPITQVISSPRQKAITLEDLPDEEKLKMHRIMQRLMVSSLFL